MTTTKGLAALSLEQLDKEFEALTVKIKNYQRTVVYGQRINDHRYSALVNRLDAVAMLIQRKNKKYEERSDNKIQGRTHKEGQVGEPS